MRTPFPELLERARLRTGDMRSNTGDDFGFFFLQRKGIRLKVMASGGDFGVPWEHVSVSTEIRCPTWEEMAWIKDLFWGEEEAVVQFHPPKSQYVNHHPFCLHLWRPLETELDLPPMIAVGPGPVRPAGQVTGGRSDGE